MWLPLNNPGLVATYVAEFPPGSGPPPALVRLLESLRDVESDRQIYAVTSLKNLWFTTASDYGQADLHPSVAVLPRAGNVSVSYARAGERKSSSGGMVPESQLEGTVRAFLAHLARGDEG
jgi:hypothetical protein